MSRVDEAMKRAERRDEPRPLMKLPSGAGPSEAGRFLLEHYPAEGSSGSNKPDPSSQDFPRESGQVGFSVARCMPAKLEALEADLASAELDRQLQQNRVIDVATAGVSRTQVGARDERRSD